MSIVRDEDIDWNIYHMIVAHPGCTGETIRELTGFEEDAVRASLVRLMKYCLIECRNNLYRACSTEEIIIKHRLPDLLTDGLELTGGVIRYRPACEGD